MCVVKPRIQRGNNGYLDRQTGQQTFEGGVVGDWVATELGKQGRTVCGVPVIVNRQEVVSCSENGVVRVWEGIGGGRWIQIQRHAFHTSIMSKGARADDKYCHLALYGHTENS